MESVGKLYRGPGLGAVLPTVSPVTFPSTSCDEAPNQKVTSLVRAAAVWKTWRGLMALCVVDRLRRSCGVHEDMERTMAFNEGRAPTREFACELASTTKSRNNLAFADKDTVSSGPGPGVLSSMPLFYRTSAYP